MEGSCDACGKTSCQLIESEGSLICPDCLPQGGYLWSGMTLEDIFDACERNYSLRSATDEELAIALKHALREIHRYEIQREIDRRAKWSRKRKKATYVIDPDFTKHARKGKCPTNKALR